MKKKWLSMAAITVMCLMVLSNDVIPSYSYLQDIDNQTNNYTVGTCDCSIVENFVKPATLSAGTVVTKDVKVKNTGSVPCYIRVYVSPSYSPSSFTFDMRADSNMSSSTPWYKDGDYYYYKNQLGVGETTSSLFTTVTLNEDMTSWDSSQTEIIVYAESVQSEGNSNCLNAFK